MKRKLSIDLLKLLLSIFIIGLHTNFLKEYSPLLSKVLVNGLFRIAVPLFFLISGFYFYETLLKKNVLKWFKKMTILYLFWMTFYLYFWVNFDIFSTIDFCFHLFFGFGHLWFVIATIQAALLLFLLRNLSSSNLLVISFGLYICGLILQYFIGYGQVFDLSFSSVITQESIYRNFLFFGFPFLSWGYLIKRELEFWKERKPVVNFLIFLGFVLLFIESSLNAYFDFNSGADLMISLAIVCPFLFIAAHEFGKYYHSKTLALYANAIYFIHIFVLLVLLHINPNLGETINTLLTILFSVILASVLVFFNQKVKHIL